ncbi:MAG: dTMP kinase [Natronomonas sp.]
MLVTVEGIDGAGKSTVIEALDDEFEGTFTREPTDSWYGAAVERSIGDETADPLAELFLYTADHAAHLSRVIEPALSAGDLVVSDRYSDSRYAYQGATLDGVIDDPVAYIRRIHEPFSRKPDLTLYLDVPATVGAERSGATNKFETAEYLKTVRENYERLIDDDPDRFVRIDATRQAGAVRGDAIEAIRQHR